MFEFRRLYCAHAKLHAPFPFDGLLTPGRGKIVPRNVINYTPGRGKIVPRNVI